MTDTERERIQKGLRLLSERPEFVGAVRLARAVTLLWASCGPDYRGWL